MMRKKHSPFLLVLVVLTGAACAHPPVPSAEPVTPSRAATQLASSSTSPSASDDGRAPMRISLTESSALSTAGDIVLHARIERRVSMGAPMIVSVQLPSGATLVRGDSSFVLPSNTVADITDREIVIHATPAPADDVVLVADARGVSSGVHGEARYRFGRPEPTSPHPVASGPPLVVNGRNLGRAIPAAGPGGNAGPSGTP